MDDKYNSKDEDYLNVAFNKEKSQIKLMENDVLNDLYFKAISDDNEFKKWSLYVCQKYLVKFYKSDFWRVITMETEKYNIKFGSENINLQICDDYVEGYYFKKDNKIVMCANMLTNYEKSFMFDQALKRQMIIMYDSIKFKNHDMKDCRFLACSEIRAANLAGYCDSSNSISNAFSRHYENKQFNEKCVKQNAISMINKYYDHCKHSSANYVEEVFPTCISDLSPKIYKSI